MAGGQLGGGAAEVARGEGLCGLCFLCGLFEGVEGSSSSSYAHV
jgi:hypothetical protein